MAESIPMPSPRRRHSKLTGAQIKHILDWIEVTREKFKRDTGLGDTAIDRILKGTSDGDIPKWVDLVLTLYLIDDEVRESQSEDIELPLSDWNINLPS
jgi:hypothetical protein